MTKTEYRDYLASEHWKERRKQFLRPYSFCFRCWMPRWLARIAYDQDLHVHHLSYARLGAETDADLSTRCRRCHEIETFGRSDLVAPPSHRCGTCGMTHWNPYSDDCDRCVDFKMAGCVIDEKLFNASVNHTDRTLWQETLFTLCVYFGVDAIVDYVAGGEPYFRRDHEWHLKMLAEKGDR